MSDPKNTEEKAPSPTGDDASSTSSHRRIRTESKASLDSSYKYSFSAVSPKVFHAMLEYGVESVQGARKTMEDQHKATCGREPVTPRGDGRDSEVATGIPFFGVYDGHGGTQCAQFLREKLHHMVLSDPKVRTEPEKALHDAILKAEEEFMELCRVEKLESGSTAAVALLIEERLVVANVGDSEIVLSRNGKAELLTTKHHLNASESEGERIRAAGGRTFHSRVGHPKFNPSLVSLAVTRAIGDAGFKLEEYTDGKASGVIAVPDTKTTVLQPGDNFFIIGCDGLWDVMSYQDAVDYCSRLLAAGATSTEISQSIVKEALNRGSSDNVTVLIVTLQKPEFKQDSNLTPTETAATPINDQGNSDAKTE